MIREAVLYNSVAAGTLYDLLTHRFKGLKTKKY